MNNNNNNKTNGKNKTNGRGPNGNGAKKPRQRGNTNGNGMRNQTVMRPFSSTLANVRPVRNAVYPHAGSDFIQVVNVKGTFSTASDRILAKFPISPSAFPGTRLTQMSQLYEFFKFTRLNLRYVPSVPVSLACQLVLYVDLDPSDDATIITNPDALIRQAVAQTGAQQWNFHTPKVIPMAMRTDQQYYFTGVDRQNVRFTQQGVAYLIQVTQALDFSGVPITTDLECGSIFFDWNCNFNIPQLNPEAALLTGIPNTTLVNYTSAVSSTQPWTPSWQPAGDKILLPRARYIIHPYLVGTGASTAATCGIKVDNSNDEVWFSRDATNLRTEAHPVVIETDADGIPNATVTITSTTTGLIDVGIRIQPLSVTYQPFPSVVLRYQARGTNFVEFHEFMDDSEKTKTRTQVKSSHENQKEGETPTT